jgi:hypothetical protein
MIAVILVPDPAYLAHVVEPWNLTEYNTQQRASTSSVTGDKENFDFVGSHRGPRES